VDAYSTGPFGDFGAVAYCFVDSVYAIFAAEEEAAEKLGVWGAGVEEGWGSVDKVFLGKQVVAFKGVN